ncbi:hypothetical protein DPMN_125603 [Dreissena polymorpha]|uniref:Uncharacterized protein n=1 Tax=Dreissena polymorpha TaxID=45954 RepID=A0A9D4GYI0_DREPO|nr:hypothetical protein DPMN_125603 [Dreissena polymorpha]
MVPIPSGHLQENPRLCQTVSRTSGSPTRYSKTVGDDANTVLVPEGDSRTVPDGARRCQTVSQIGARQYNRPSGTSRRLPDSL